MRATFEIVFYVCSPNCLGKVIFFCEVRLTLSVFEVSSFTTVQDFPSSLWATLKETINWTEPKSLAPCVMIPVIFFGDSRSTWKHTSLQNDNSAKIYTQIAPWPAFSYLQPLRAIVGGSCPGVGLSLLVQPSKVWVPGESLKSPGAKRAGGCDLPVQHQSGLHTHGLWATWSVWIHCGGESGQSGDTQDERTKGEKKKKKAW